MPWPTRNYEDGESIILETDKTVKVILIDNEPELYYTHYINGKSTKCNGSDCEHCAEGDKPNEKGSMLVQDVSDGKQKKLKGSAALFISLKEVLDMCGVKTGFIFSIKATGEKQKRRYHCVPLPLQAEKTDEKVPF